MLVGFRSSAGPKSRKTVVFTPSEIAILLTLKGLWEFVLQNVPF